MTGLIDTGYKTAIIKMFKDLKGEKRNVMSKQMGKFSKYMETIKRGQMQILELKSTISEIKVFFVYT